MANGRTIAMAQSGRTGQNRKKEHRDVNLQKITELSLNAGKKTVEQ
jgi:hypothetical protein